MLFYGTKYLSRHELLITALGIHDFTELGLRKFAVKSVGCWVQELSNIQAPR